MSLRLAKGDDHRKNPELFSYRYMTVLEAQQLKPGDTVEWSGRDGRARRAKVNGKPQTWKTQPSRVRVPLKYGLYDYFQAVETQDNRVSANEGNTAFLVVPE